MEHRKGECEEELKDLNFRLALVKKCISTIEEEHEDPRAPDALEHYRGQLTEIEQQIAEFKAQLEGPHDVVIGLAAAQLFAKRGDL